MYGQLEAIRAIRQFGDEPCIATLNSLMNDSRMFHRIRSEAAYALAQVCLATIYLDV